MEREPWFHIIDGLGRPPDLLGEIGDFAVDRKVQWVWRKDTWGWSGPISYYPKRAAHRSANFNAELRPIFHPVAVDETRKLIALLLLAAPCIYAAIFAGSRILRAIVGF